MRRFRGRALSFFVIVALLVPFAPPPQPAPAAAPPPLDTEYTPPSIELAGDDRVKTAVHVSQEGWVSSDYVVIATSANFPDALAGAPLAHALSAPLLLTSPTRLSADVADEVARLRATRAVVLGGEQALAPAVIDGLVAAGIPRGDIERVAGANRYETARDIALKLQATSGPATGVVVASGRTYPDALAVAGFAARSNRPILLTAPDTLPAATAEALFSIVSTDTIIVGGPSAVSDAVADELPDPLRIGGENRYETATLIAEHAFRSGVMAYEEILLATGERFPDALAAGPFAAKRASTLILTRSQSVPSATEDFVRAHTSSTQRIVFLGGTSAVSGTVRDAILEAATTRIAEGIRLVDAGTQSQLVAVTADELLFDAETPLLADLEEDQILIGEPSAAAPDGYLRRVLGVTDADGMVSVETTGVVIEELIEDGSIDVAQQITPDDIVGDEVLADGVTVEHGGAGMVGALADGFAAQSTQFNYNELKVTLKDVAVGAAKINGSLSVKPSYDFHVRAANFQLQEARFTTTITEVASLMVAGPPMKKEVELYEAPTRRVKTMVGPVPVWVSATFKLVAGVDASGGVNLRVGVEQEATITSGLEYRSGSWGPVSEFSSSFRVIKPTASADVTVEVYAGASAALKLYDLAGPYGEVKPLVECTFTIGGDPWWRAKRAIDLTAGFVVGIDVGTGWLKWTWTLAEVSDTWRVAEASLGQSSGPYEPPPADDPPGDDPPGDDPPGDDPPDDAVVMFPDANLEAAVRSALDIPVGDITEADMARLTELDVGRYRGISDLRGLEYAINLAQLDLHVNQISDLSPLAGLTGLGQLNLGANQISDLSPLAGLTGLGQLDLRDNQISDLSPLAGLENLEYLNLWNNQISDLSPLVGLTNLGQLDLSANQISDLSPLAGLTELFWLDLGRNWQMSDLSPLAGLTNLVELGIHASHTISDLSPLAGLTNLMALDASWNRIEDLSPLAGLTNLRVLDLAGNQISDLSALAGLKNLVALDVSLNNLSELTLVELPILEEIHAWGNDISELTLVDLTNLLVLDISLNSLSGLRLAGLPTLERIDAWGNEITDITLVGLTNLTALDVAFNHLSNLPLVGLTNLEHINAVHNEISDLSALAELTTLQFLSLTNNQISDLSPLAGLTNLRDLQLSDNQISDLSPLLDTFELRPHHQSLYLWNNPLDLNEGSDAMSVIETLESWGVHVAY